jgi:hypothetical protein
MQSHFDVFSSMREALTTIRELNKCLQSLGQAEGSFRTGPSAPLADDLLRRDALVLTFYEKSIKAISTLLTNVESLSGQVAATDGSGSVSLPTPDEARNKLTAFFLSKPQTRMPGQPLPVHAGCRAYLRRAVIPGQFICGRYRNVFTLMIVVSAQPDEFVTAYSPVEALNAVEPVQLEPAFWTPLPTVIPDKPQQRWEFVRDSQVLALWKRSEDDWTTEFFEAKVVSRPCDRADEPVRGYLLEFKDLGTAVVPEHFVVAGPSAWKK